MIESTLDALLPIMSITLGIGMVVVSILSKHRRDMRALEHRHEERMAAIEKGLDFPPEPVTERTLTGSKPFAARGEGAGGSRYLLRGLIWFGAGLALALSNSFLGEGFRIYGWVGVAVGVAYLIYYLVEGRRERPPAGNGEPPA